MYIYIYIYIYIYTCTSVDEVGNDFFVWSATGEITDIVEQANRVVRQTGSAFRFYLRYIFD